MNDAWKVRSLCLSLVLDAVVSYRSIPRILTLVETKTALTLGWIPHFTSVINWTLRLGLGLLKQVAPMKEEWAAIVDHSIDIGTKKVLVVLRVPLDCLSLKLSAIELKDCECIGLSVSDTVNGEHVRDDLDRIFTQAGNPSVIIKDRDSTLQKGVTLCAEKNEVLLPVVDDIGHVIANALKAEYEQSTGYNAFISLCKTGASRLRQTSLAFLIPPKLRTKGRFQSIGKLAKWGNKMLQVLDFVGPAEKGSTLQKVRDVFAELPTHRDFIDHFTKTNQLTSEILKCLKNQGLNPHTHKHCKQLSDQLPNNSKVSLCLHNWLQTHQAVQHQFPKVSLPVSSDIIESLFGNFKHVLERSPQADMNRTVLLIPALCGVYDEKSVTQTLQHVPHKALKKWDKENIPYTLRRKRQKFLTGKIQISGN